MVAHDIATPRTPAGAASPRFRCAYCGKTIPADRVARCLIIGVSPRFCKRYPCGELFKQRERRKRRANGEAPQRVSAHAPVQGSAPKRSTEAANGSKTGEPAGIAAAYPWLAPLVKPPAEASTQADAIAEPEDEGAVAEALADLDRLIGGL